MNSRPTRRARPRELARGLAVADPVADVEIGGGEGFGGDLGLAGLVGAIAVM
ncbi:MAG: hypothetical protein R3D59_05635 [Paracoccaceae bacterium]